MNDKPDFYKVRPKAQESENIALVVEIKESPFSKALDSMTESLSGFSKI